MNFQRITIPSEFLQFVDAAIVRCSYLYPDFEIKCLGKNIEISSSSIEEFITIKQEFFQLLYKERIYSDTLEIRASLFRAISDD